MNALIWFECEDGVNWLNCFVSGILGCWPPEVWMDTTVKIWDVRMLDCDSKSPLTPLHTLPHDKAGRTIFQVIELLIYLVLVHEITNVSMVFLV